MYISSVQIKGYRNFSDATINMVARSLIIGANDAGKTNFLGAIRLLLDRSLSDVDLDPSEQDFHIRTDGHLTEMIEISVKFANCTKDAILSIFKGHISASAELILKYVASREDLSYKLYAGRDESSLEEISSRFYLKHLSLKFVDSQRDLERYIRTEKKNLLKISQRNRSAADVDADNKIVRKVGKSLSVINERIRKLNYVSAATSDVNSELQAMALHHRGYNVQLDTGAVQVTEFIEKLELAGSTNGSKVILGGDGRNNQILLALWKAKSMQEHDPTHEVVIYCVEEPEAHLHPHQQRSLASYLTDKIPGQTIVTTHSPAIVANYSPESIIRLVCSAGETHAASNGCSKCIKESWEDMGYRISILPAEAFFASAVLLVEGPSEMIFYHALAKSLDIDLDFYNISILSVDGVQFEVYASILDALEIPYALRTDNDISDITLGSAGNKYEARNLAGMNRALTLAKQKKMLHVIGPYTQYDSVNDGIWSKVCGKVEPFGIFLSKIDLEHDLGDELSAELIAFKGPTVKDCVNYLQDKKATRMRQFIKHGPLPAGLKAGKLAAPLNHCVDVVKSRMGI